MKKEKIKRGLRMLRYIFLVVLLWSFPAFSGGGEEISPAEDYDELDLEKLLETVYSAARHKQDIAESPSAITVITREQIQNTHCNDLICLLREVPEVEVRRVRPLHAPVGARAQTAPGHAPRTLLLIDGREINLEVLGFPFWTGLPVHLEDIERIEVLRGPGSALYGANAHSMVVSITTRKPSKNAYRVFLGGGEHDNTSLYLSVDRVLTRDWRFQFSGGYETSGHWRIKDRREREFGRVRLRIDHEAESSNQSFHLGLISGGGAYNTGIAPAELKDSTIGHAAFFHQEDDFLRAQVTYRFLDTDISLDMPLIYREIKLGEFPEKWHLFSSDLDTEVQITWEPFDGNLLITGGNYRWIFSELEDNDPPTTNQHRVGIFLQDEQRLGENFILTAGVRFDYNNITPFTISPRAAGIWQFAENQHLRLSFGRAFRKPNFFNTSVHYTGVKSEPGFEEFADFIRNSIGDENVSNENITTFEVGYRGRFLENRLKVEADVFFNLYRDTIIFRTHIVADDMGLPDLSRSVMKFLNTEGGVDSLGGSVSLTGKISKALRIGANYTFRHSWYISEPDDDYAVYATKGDRVPWEPAHILNFSFRYLPKRGLRLGMTLHGSSSTDVSMPSDGTAFSERIMIHSPGRIFVSGFVSWPLDLKPLGSVEVGVRAYNLFNSGFHDSPSVTRPDGTEVGGELIGRQILLFLRGTI